jgi:hypothetical protein
MPWINLGKIDWIFQTRALHQKSPVLEWLAEDNLPAHRIQYAQYPHAEV